MIDDDSPGRPAGYRPGRGAAPGDRANAAAKDERREPVFTAFDADEDEDYEESERDTDFASAYEDDDEEYLESMEDDDPEALDLDWQVLGGSPGLSGSAHDAHRNPWADSDPAGAKSDDRGADTTDHGPALTEPSEQDEDDGFSDDEFTDNEITDEAEEDWEDEEDYADDPDDFEQEPAEHAQGWPLGMVVVGIVALVLLAAGGYGVIQQRSSAQEEIRQLQAALATAGSPAELAASRDALRAMEERNTEIQASLDALTLENRRLGDTVAGLEKQLSAQQAALKAPAPNPAPAVKPATPAARPAATGKAPPKPGPAATATAPGGDWFVNFSSYTQRSAAESWVKRLQPSVGKAVVAAGDKDGRTFYRVRIIGLADRAQAEKVAAQLQAAHNLPPLWVGRE
ncbi:MAG: SPOR domain-containing protein [Pseudomonadales bacterium]|nr:SPOR domain-containing protein [Halioglobus sp.]MCP5121264.1 SPOR domain-containing protein [Pseudomonadales bacterium]MCP5193396.1 SPOR domain-containing protein [Pseudomonadales bacterium]